MKAAVPLALLALLLVNWVAANTSPKPTVTDTSPSSPTSDSTDTTSDSADTTSDSTDTTSDSTDTTSDSADTTSNSTDTTSNSTDTTSDSQTAATSKQTATDPPTTASSLSPDDTSVTTPSSTDTSPLTSHAGSASSHSSIAAPTSPNDSPGPSTSKTSFTTQENSSEIAPSSAPQVTSNSTPSSSQTSGPDTGTTGSINYCQSNPCGDDASCVSLYSTYVCLCVEGYYYNLTKCERGKIFPGEIGVLVSETSGLDDTNSEAYEDLYNNLNAFFENALSPDFKQTVILKVSTSSSLSARSGLRASDQTTVYVWVVNILSESTELNETMVTDLIVKAIEANSTMTGYTSQTRCDFYGCEENEDDCNNNLECTCKAGMQRPTPLSPACVAVGCSERCDAQLNKQCVQSEDSGEFKCVCLPGYRNESGNCRECPFGYNGVNCTDQFELILTIVGTIAGVLLLGLVIALILARSKNKKKNTEEQHLIENDFLNLRLQQTGFSNLGAEGSIFPKAKTVASKDFRAQNPYENHGSLPRPDY